MAEPGIDLREASHLPCLTTGSMPCTTTVQTAHSNAKNLVLGTEGNPNSSDVIIGSERAP